MYKVIILPLAKKNIRKSAHWYNKQKKGLGKQFTSQIRKEIDYISQNPIAIQIRYNKIRTAVVKVFPFMIHYSIDPIHKLIIISGVYHTSQNSKNWKGF